MPNFTLEQADKELFAVYQVIYSDSDIEMWYDWNERLKDTTFSDQCFWIKSGTERIGGAMITNGMVMYPFLITPFSDRTVFWKALMNCCDGNVQKVNGVLHKDVDILLSFGYRVDLIRQVMSCPTDTSVSMELPNDFSLHYFCGGYELNTLAKVITTGYEGGIDNETFGAPSEDEVMKDVKRLIKIYANRDLSIYIFDEKLKEIAGVCIAGISVNNPLGFAEIGEICVLPQYRNKQLAECMLKHVRANAYENAQVVKLCVTVGNVAENLYRKVGFFPGPRFVNMSRR